MSGIFHENYGRLQQRGINQSNHKEGFVVMPSVNDFTKWQPATFQQQYTYLPSNWRLSRGRKPVSSPVWLGPYRTYFDDMF